ncbi:MAG: NAD(P)-binding domain-containing protein [Rhizobiaceae bacterium]|nr:NAD(P)-binding domain-containing protein [Rhizobiaceae bacterium]
MQPVDVLVVGAGQAGLAAGYHLRSSGLTYLIVDANQRIGDSWRRRYRSLTLFTPRQFSSLPDLPMPGNREQYPTRDEFADYLESYATACRLPIRIGARVSRLRRQRDGRFEAAFADGSVATARAVIIATGGFQLPLVPEVARGFSDEVTQITAESYRDPSQIADGRVLVVGDGASGRDIAAELAPLRETWLATGKPRLLFPERILSKSVWWWLALSGLLCAPEDSFFGRMLKKNDAFPDRDRSVESLKRFGVRVVGRLTHAGGSGATFGDGHRADIRTVIWAVGYRDDTGWVDIAEAKDSRGAFAHTEGVSPVPGIYFVGRPWQRNRASALVMGAGADAERIVSRIRETVRGKLAGV